MYFNVLVSLNVRTLNKTYLWDDMKIHQREENHINEYKCSKVNSFS